MNTKTVAVRAFGERDDGRFEPGWEANKGGKRPKVKHDGSRGCAVEMGASQSPESGSSSFHTSDSLMLD